MPNGFSNEQDGDGNGGFNLRLTRLAAAIYDARYRRIPNWLTVTGVLIGLSLNAYQYGVLPSAARIQYPWACM